MNSIEVETEDGVSRDRKGQGETESEAEVKVEAEAEGPPEGEAHRSITHITEAERLAEVTHQLSGARQEGAQM